MSVHGFVFGGDEESQAGFVLGNRTSEDGLGVDSPDGQNSRAGLQRSADPILLSDQPKSSFQVGWHVIYSL